MNKHEYKTLLFDLDGTMYRGKEPIEAGIRAIDFCHEHGIPWLFLTNNSMRTPEENVRHMEEMGYRHIRPEQFVNSAMAAAAWAAKQDKPKTAWYVGAQGMKQALLDHGFVITDENPSYVFVGLDKEADYHTYSKALALLLGGAQLVGTNLDRILAKPGGFEVGNGSIVRLFEYATGQTSPEIGKPALPILEAALEHGHLRREDVILVGDNLETDIALGYDNQVQTVFVQSGVHHKADIDRLQIVPDVILNSLDEADFLRLCQVGAHSLV